MNICFHHQNLSTISTFFNKQFIEPGSPSKELILFGINADALFISPDKFKLYQAVSRGKKGMVLTHPNIRTREKFGTSLPDDNIAGPDFLTPKFFYTKTFALTITAITAGTTTFFMGHLNAPMPLFHQYAGG
jgi:hypothetical protein